MSDSDDWAVIGSGHGTASASDALPAALFDSTVAPPVVSDAVARVHGIRRQRPLARFLPKGIPHPKRRSLTEGALAAARMRERKIAPERRRMKQAVNSFVSETIRVMQQGTTARTGRLQILKAAKLDFQLPYLGRSKKHNVSPGKLLEIAFSPVSKRNELAKSLQLQPRTVAVARLCVAASLHGVVARCLLCIGDQLKKNPKQVTVFAVGTAMDETKEVVRLPLEHGLTTGVTRNAWGVFVVIQRFSWMIDDKVHQLDLYRPIVPLVGTNAESLVEALEDMPQIKFYHDFEVIGLDSSVIGAKHVDRDGHFGTAKAVHQNRQLSN